MNYELERDEAPDCRFNDGVGCFTGERINCTHCGWNPYEDFKRKRKMNKEMRFEKLRRVPAVGTGK